MRVVNLGLRCAFQTFQLTEIADNEQLPAVNSSSETIADLLRTEKKIVNIIAVIYDLSEPQMISCRYNTVQQKQTVHLVDDSERIIALDLWNTYVGKLAGKDGQVVTFKNLCVKEFRNKKILETTADTIIDRGESSDKPREKKLKRWWHSRGLRSEFRELILESVQ